jgi:NitT/TauT family transport system substrate-binding protein
MRSSIVAGAVALALAAVVAGCGGSSDDQAASKSGLTPVTFAVAVAAPDPGQIFLFAPEGGGFFKQEGLQVKPLFNNGGQAALQQVATGKAQFGLTSMENLINGVAQGLPLKAFATVITRTVYHAGVGVPADSPITSYDQLKGKSVGVSALTSGSYPFAQGALAESGLDPAKDVKFAIIGNGGPAADAIKSGKVAGAVTTETQWATIQALGVNVRFLEPEPAISKLPADVLVANKDYLESHKDLAAKFARAIMEGTVAASKNPDAAIGWYDKQFDTAADAKSREDNLAVMKARLADLQQVPAQEGKWGQMPMSEYETVQNQGVKYQIIKKPIDLSTLLTNELVPQINQFDQAKVEATVSSTG